MTDATFLPVIDVERVSNGIHWTLFVMESRDVGRPKNRAIIGIGNGSTLTVINLKFRSNG